MGQSPDAELRAHQRFVAPLLRIAVRRPRKGRARCEGLRRRGEGFVLVREAVVPVKVLDVGLEVIVARKTRGVVDQQAAGDQRLRRVERLDQPTTVVRIVVEIDSPSFVEQGPDADGRMMPVVDDGAAKRLPQGLARRGREELRVGHVEPDDEAEPVGQIEIDPVRNLDVAAQRVEPHRLGVAEPLLEKRLARRPALFLRVPVLIERAGHEKGLAVQQQAPVSGLEAPEADRPLQPVDRRPAAYHFDGERVEVGSVRRPGVRS